MEVLFEYVCYGAQIVTMHLRRPTENLGAPPPVRACPGASGSRCVLARVPSEPRPPAAPAVPPAATIHQYTQSYFLSGTDATGVPVKWTRIIKLENVSADALPGHLRLPRQNAKPGYGRLVEMVRADPELRCGICDIYRQDFVCFGYRGCEGCTGGLPMEIV